MNPFFSEYRLKKNYKRRSHYTPNQPRNTTYNPIFQNYHPDNIFLFFSEYHKHSIIFDSYPAIIAYCIANQNQTNKQQYIHVRLNSLTPRNTNNIIVVKIVLIKHTILLRTFFFNIFSNTFIYYSFKGKCFPIFCHLFSTFICSPAGLFLLAPTRYRIAGPKLTIIPIIKIGKSDVFKKAFPLSIAIIISLQYINKLTPI